MVTTERVRAELLAHAPEGIAPGQPLWVGLQIAHQPEWHTYWKNPGDSGLPTTLAWTLPAGIEVGEVAWPLPKEDPGRAAGQLRLRGHGAAAGAPDRHAGLQALARSASSRSSSRPSWLVCKKECIPEDGSFVLKLPARSTTALHAGLSRPPGTPSPRT